MPRIVAKNVVREKTVDYVEAGIFYITECIYDKGITVTYLQSTTAALMRFLLWD